MKNILDKIVEHKRKELEAVKANLSVSELEKSPQFEKKSYSLTESLKHPERTGIIAEFKRQSPSKGIINDQAKVADVTQAYEKYGASGVSVLTNQEFFGGTVEDVKAARAIEIPILRKEFIVDEYQIIEAKAIGADVILLIAECLTASEVKDFTQLAHSLGMQVILEMHSEKQLDKIAADQQIVGINNRDLTTFKVDLEQSIKLCHRLPPEMLKIAESGISNPQTILDLKKEGFDGFLIGENFMKQSNPGTAFKEFVEQLNF